MARLLSLVGATIGGVLGWWAGAKVGLMTAFIGAIVGTAVDVYVGRRIAADYLPQLPPATDCS
jgi:uncharacterized membrane protein